MIDGLDGKGPPIDCTHCGRWIPGDMIASYDTSGCPLAKPCGKPAASTAWPMARDDDDEDESSAPLLPVLEGGAR